MLFNVYMDQLSIKLNQSSIGGNIGGHLIHHLCYADDLCLISLSSAGMQKLLDICSSYAIEHLLMSNVTCLRLTALIYIMHPCGLIVQKQC